MSRKKRKIRPLQVGELKDLQAGMKSEKSYQFAQRCHAILLSHEGFEVSELVRVFSVSKNTLYTWFKRYENNGISGLKNKPGQGRKPTLCIDNKEHVEAVEKSVNKVNENGGNLLAEVEQELGLDKGLSMKILRSFLKKKIMSISVVEES